MARGRDDDWEDELFSVAVELADGRSKESLVDELVDDGWDEDDAHNLVDEADLALDRDRELAREVDDELADAEERGYRESHAPGIYSDGPPPSTTMALGLSIACMLCCFLPGGILGLALAIQAKNAGDAGDYEGAEKKIKQTYMVIGISAFIGAIVNAVYFTMTESLPF